MSEVTTKTVEINLAVALEEAAHLAEFYRNRNLVNAQSRFELAQANQALGQQVTELQAKVETFLAEAVGTVEQPAIIEPQKPKA